MPNNFSIATSNGEKHTSKVTEYAFIFKIYDNRFSAAKLFQNPVIPSDPETENPTATACT